MKVKHGKSIDITSQLSPDAATVIAQWIGGYTVIYNQKTRLSESATKTWLSAGRPAESKPAANATAAYLQDDLPFLREIPSQIRRNAGAKWFEAYSASIKGVRKHPVVRPRHKKRNCYVTNELFDVQALDDERCLIQLKARAGKQGRGHYLAGFVMPFSADNAGKALFLSRKGRRFWLSMGFDNELDVLSQDQIREIAHSLSEGELSALVTGHDLGVKRQVTASTGAVYHLSKEALASLDATEKRRVRYQRRYSRMACANDRKAGTNKRQRSNHERKLLTKIARYGEKKAHIQNNNSHHISKAIAESTPLIAAFEDIKIGNMVRKPKAKLCEETGRFLPNGARAKGGLNRALHSVNLGQIRQFTEYKLRNRGKLMIRVRAQYSSQECSACGYTHKDNRASQADFTCQQCGFAANADDNASCVIKQRGIALILSESFLQGKTVRVIKVRRKKAPELASSGSGDVVSPAVQAIVDDALNSQLTMRNHCLLEARRL